MSDAPDSLDIRRRAEQMRHDSAVLAVHSCKAACAAAVPLFAQAADDLGAMHGEKTFTDRDLTELRRVMANMVAQIGGQLVLLNEANDEFERRLSMPDPLAQLGVTRV